MQCRHQLSFRRKWDFTFSGHFLPQFRQGKPCFFRRLCQRFFCRLAKDSPAFFLRIVAECEKHQHKFPLFRVTLQRPPKPCCFYDFHAILRQRPRFVGTDNLRAAQRFHSGQTPDNGVPLGHPLHTDCQNDGDNGRQAFRNCGHSKADRSHEHRKRFLMPQKPHRKYHAADCQSANAQRFPRFAQLFLQRRFAVLLLRKKRGNPPDFRIHACCRNNSFACAGKEVTA